MKEMMRRRPTHGFTLIELLIVVAIIGILAAIAVPNFLNARIRANVARVHSDQRSFGNAMEMYYLDNNDYPWTDSLPHGNMPLEKRWVPLTTPISYIASLPYDPFGDHSKDNKSTMAGNCTYLTYDSWVARPRMSHYGFIESVARDLNMSNPGGMLYAFVSQGPDLKVWACEGGHLVYSGSNGLMSWGDIVRAGPGGLNAGG